MNSSQVPAQTYGVWQSYETVAEQKKSLLMEGGRK